MKKFLCIFILILNATCTEKKITKSEQITKYYQGYKEADYKQIKEVISDSLTIIEGDYTVTHTPESFYKQFKWDSVFRPVYKLVNIENKDEDMVATISVSSLRFEFLKNNPLISKNKFHFKSGKINTIETIDFIDVNWELWQKERDSLVNWIKINNVELDGFIHDLSMKGAIDYLNAIELYKKDQIKETD